jgi:hypothetical protein
MSLKSNNKPPRSPQELQVDIENAEMVEKWVRMIESEEFTVAIEYTLNLFKLSHPPDTSNPHLHAHNISSVLAAINFKQALIDNAYNLKYSSNSQQQESSDFID